MWFKVGIKDTNWCNYIELDSEDKHKIIAEFFTGAYQYLNSTRVVRQDILSAMTNDTIYPVDCEVEMMEKPPQKWINDRLKQLDKLMSSCEEEYNKLSDLRETN